MFSIHIDVLSSLFSEARNPIRAAQSEAYLKHHFKFIGLTTPQRREIQKEWVASLKSIDNHTDRWALVHTLWNQVEREYHHVALDWINTWPKKWMEATDSIHLEKLLRTHAWWDSVDTIAANYLGKWAEQFPKEARITFERWRYDESFWLQRSCLIYQLKYGLKTDTEYLLELINQMHLNKEFFIQKAIGWSLRQLSKKQPEATEYILQEVPLKGLALREASKYI